MPKVVQKQALGETYPAVRDEDRAAAIACAGAYAIVSQPEAELVVADRQSGGRLEAWLENQLEAGRGVVVQLPDFSTLPPASRPKNRAAELFCQGDDEVGVQPALFSTVSLHEALGMLAGADSFVLAEPKGGWTEEQAEGATLSLSWGWLGAAGAAVAIAGYYVLR